MSRLSPPLIPFPDDLLLPMPVPMPPPPSPARQSPREPLASVVSSLMDLSREGPFDAYCVLADTGSHPLILDGLPGCLTGCRWEVMCLAFGPELFPSEAVPRVHRAATQMSAMGLWRPQAGPGVPGPMPVSSCNNCMGCSDCSPEKSG